MTEQPVISVRGEAHLEADPEIATLSVTVQARDSDRHAVADRLAARNAQLLALLKGYGEAIEKVESGAAAIAPDIRHKERVRSYAGRASVWVEVRDFTVLGELVTRIADGDLVTVAGPWWSLRPGSPVYRQARITAAKDATLRAEEYAEAFGGELGGLIEAADTGLLSDRGPGTPVRHVAAARGTVGAAPGGMDDAATMDFEPVQQTVTARVEARFRMHPPQP